MTKADEVTLKDLMAQGFQHLGNKVDALQKDVDWVKGQIGQQQSIHLECLARQAQEKGAMWAAIGKADTKQARSNGFREGQHYAQERAEWWRYINWEKWCAIGALVGVAIMVVFKII